MITIALDEAGVFEELQKESNNDSLTTLIGGIFFDDKGDECEFDNEKKRIEAYYRLVIDSVNKQFPELHASYPMDLHSRNGKNNHKVRNVKKKVSETLPGFLQDGLYEGNALIYENQELPERTGKYIICAVVKSSKGKTDLLNRELGEFFRDDVASNMYYHMASDVVEHLIFHNPLYPNIGKLNLDIATRQSSLLDQEESEIYEEFGYTRNNRDDLEEGIKQYSLMNADVFRTILTEQMLNEPKKDISISSYKVRSISYYPNKKSKDHVFLYMADTICSFLTRNIGEDDVVEVRKRAQKLINQKNLIFAYDEVDLYFKRAWQAMEIKEYYDALKEIFTISTMDTPEAKLYQEYWIKYIKEKIQNETLEDVKDGRLPYAFSEALDELRSAYMTNALNPAREEFIYSVLSQSKKALEEDVRYSKLLYYINDIGVLINCHKGNLKDAEPYFKNCEKYAGSVDLEEYTRTRNRYTNTLLDYFEYEKAIGVIRVTLDLLGGLYNLSRQKLGRGKLCFGKTEYAKTLSQAGQTAAFLRDKEALSFFDESIALMRDNLANKKITQSYRLHYLIEAGEKELYIDGMKEYCGDVIMPSEQLIALKEMGHRGDVNPSFALYLFLKGAYFFYSEDELDAVWCEILDYEKSIDIERKTSHPWELIYKYLGLISLKLGKMEQAKQYANMIPDSVEIKDKSLVTAIALFAEAELTDAMGDGALAGNKYTKLYEKMEKNFPLFNPDCIKQSKSKGKKEYMKKRFSYMYN